MARRNSCKPQVASHDRAKSTARLKKRPQLNGAVFLVLARWVSYQAEIVSGYARDKRVISNMVPAVRALRDPRVNQVVQEAAQAAWSLPTNPRRGPFRMAVRRLTKSQGTHFCVALLRPSAPSITASDCCRPAAPIVARVCRLRAIPETPQLPSVS